MKDIFWINLFFQDDFLFPEAWFMASSFTEFLHFFSDQIAKLKFQTFGLL